MLLNWTALYSQLFLIFWAAHVCKDGGENIRNSSQYNVVQNNSTFNCELSNKVSVSDQQSQESIITHLFFKTTPLFTFHHFNLSIAPKYTLTYFTHTKIQSSSSNIWQIWTKLMKQEVNYSKRNCVKRELSPNLLYCRKLI